MMIFYLAVVYLSTVKKDYMLMNERIANFPQQMREAITIGENAKLSAATNKIQQVLITGLGGSGIGGSVFSQIVDKEIKVPVVVNKDYFIPAFVNENTLVIISSYSGNTEETVQAMEAALKQNAKICCVTSGGKIQEIAEANHCDLILIPGGNPPRSCFGYSFTQLFYILEYHQLISKAHQADLQNAVDLLEKEQMPIRTKARAVAESLVGKMPVIYCEARYEGVAVRLRQQINENSKMLCWHHVLPEMNHNELVGWTEAHPEVVVLMFRSEDDYSRTQKRMEISKEVFLKYTPNYIELPSKGTTQLQRSIYLLHLGDWISWYVSEIKNIDATEVKVIDYLKGSLANL
ncbi:MAG: bifunctional phosphoglucose/phosphomannose isomerase [Bacteroidota bacterium]